MLETHIVIIISLLATAGGTLLFIGSLFSAITALGNKQYIFGWAIFIFFPLSVVYCALNWDKAAYSGKMVFSGTFLLLIFMLIILQYI